MTEKQTESENKPSKATYIARRIGVGAAVAGVAAATVFGAPQAAEIVKDMNEANELTQVESDFFTIGQGQGVEAAAKDYVEGFFLREGIDPANIPTTLINSEARAAGEGYIALTGEDHVDPGVNFFITIKMNENQDRFDIDIQPPQIPTAEN